MTIATGSFTLHQGAGENRTFTFTAITLPSGEVTGQAQLISFGGVEAHISIDCFVVVGNQAVLGGTVTKSTEPLSVGQPVFFAIQDDPDIATFTLAGEGLTCENLAEFFGFSDLTGLFGEFGIAVEEGNIAIRQAN